jgi:hypothetical protein
MSEKPISPLRQRMIEDMTVRNFGEKTRNDYIRRVKTFTTFLGRSPDTATAEDPTGVRPPTMNGSVLRPHILARSSRSSSLMPDLMEVTPPVRPTKCPAAAAGRGFRRLSYFVLLNVSH